MKIVQIVPGSGDNFYCENCVRDNSLVRALLARGEQVLAVPLYLPREIDTLDQTTDAPLFFGGINSYLQQKSGLFRHTPRWLDRFLDSRFLLRIAAHRAGSVRASGLGEMTLSMLQGRAGHQKKELERLIEWLGSIGKIDVVHISSPLLLGIGEEVKRRLGLPIVCTMQDEDTWIDAMDDPYPARCWDAMRQAAEHVDVFVGVSRYFAGVMQERMQLPEDRVRVVPIGVDTEAFSPASAPAEEPVLGYLSRMSEPLGLGVLVDTFLRLKKTPGLEGLRLHASGGSTADDKPFLTRLHRTLASEGVADDVRFFDHFDPDARRELLSSLTVLSVPAANGMAFGTYILEALASGVPVVEPSVGSFPELLEATGGGVLYDADRPDALFESLRDLLTDRDRIVELGSRGREAVRRDFCLEPMARRMLEVYESVTSGKVPASTGRKS